MNRDLKAIFLSFVRLNLSLAQSNDLEAILDIREKLISQLLISGRRNRSLTPEEKRENKVFAQKRIYVEHVIRKTKIFRIAQQRFRLRGKRYPVVMKVICGLVRFRIGALVLPPNETETAMTVPFSNGLFSLSFS